MPGNNFFNLNRMPEPIVLSAFPRPMVEPVKPMIQEKVEKHECAKKGDVHHIRSPTSTVGCHKKARLDTEKSNSLRKNCRA